MSESYDGSSGRGYAREKPNRNQTEKWEAASLSAVLVTLSHGREQQAEHPARGA